MTILWAQEVKSQTGLQFVIKVNYLIRAITQRILRLGISLLVLGLAGLAWQWSRDQDLIWWLPGQVLLAILSPVFILIGLRMLLARGAAKRRGLESWADPYAVVGLLLGVANAYFLGVWRSVSREGLQAFAPLLLIVGLVGGLMMVRRRRADARAGASQK